MMGMVALYIRISLEDDDLKENTAKEESNSIQNQRKLLRGFLEEREEFAGYAVREFVDDGYTGRNFDRPGFQEMIGQCRQGLVSCIVVKDLSRLGRNYVEVGNLLEQVFPFLGIRVVSVSDHYDSAALTGITGGLDVAFTNLVYNLYSRDLSQKIKSATRTRMERGEFIGPFGLYGYRKDPEDVHKLVIDEEAAKVVRRIFGLVLKKTPRIQIARMLNEEGVLTPSEYKAAVGCSRSWGEEGKHGKWTSTLLAKIIRDERYAGNMVSGKKVYESFDSKHQIEVDKSQWVRVENTHPGIVTQEEYDAANANMKVRKKSEKEKPRHSKKDFSVIVCPHCGRCLRPGKTREDYMFCPTGITEGADSPCRNIRIRQRVAEDTILALIRQQAALVADVEQRARQEKDDQKKGKAAIRKMKGELVRLKARKVADYEDYKGGRIEKRVFLEWKAAADAEIRELEDAVRQAECRDAFEGSGDTGGNAESRQALGIKEYLDIREYNKTVAAAFIRTAKVLSETELEITWKYQDIYEKYLSL